jgi:hypothetical protein
MSRKKKVEVPVVDPFETFVKNIEDEGKEIAEERDSILAIFKRTKERLIDSNNRSADYRKKLELVVSKAAAASSKAKEQEDANTRSIEAINAIVGEDKKK